MPLSPTSRLAVLAVFALGVGALAGCGKGGEERRLDVGAARAVEDPIAVAPPGTSPARRLGDVSSPFDWEAPTGWRTLPPTRMRLAAFAIASDPATECTLTYFPEPTGTVAANVNRWRRQMGLDALDDSAVSTLPVRRLLRMPAVLVDLRGRYRGMGDGTDVPDARLLGLILLTERESVFVKLVGPAAVVDGEVGRFDAFCASIRPVAGWRRGPADGADDAPENPPTSRQPPPAVVRPPTERAPEEEAEPPPAVAGESGEARGIRWVWPAGWGRATGGSAMRAASFAVESAPNVDVALTVLTGSGGGLAANLNRWRGQMSLPELSSAEIAALPRIPALGGRAVVVSIDGALTPMRGPGAPQSEPIPGQTLLGAVIEREDDVVFVKATGPEADVKRIRASFDAFVASLTAAEPRR